MEIIYNSAKTGGMGVNPYGKYLYHSKQDKLNIEYLDHVRGEIVKLKNSDAEDKEFKLGLLNNDLLLATSKYLDGLAKE